ncbi:hypothetical protein [Nocardia suismassiliense]|uniref:hypothetical protein n=1 Tax=Nocardia suismassiliense TaxID=2077092 RepID=UPI00131F22FD|nr:hypothetical protein [Nocardia suismassiliense]
MPLLHTNTRAWPETVFAVIAFGAATRPSQLSGLDSTIVIYPTRALALGGSYPALTAS